MKFGKTYTEFIETEVACNQLAGCSYVEFGGLKKVLKKCTMHDSSSSGDDLDFATSTCSSHSCCEGSQACTTSGRKPLSNCQTKTKQGLPASPLKTAECPSSCPAFSTVCGLQVATQSSLGSWMEELSEVIGCFNNRAEQLVKLHLATGLRKYILRGKRNNREAMIQEGQLLFNYASMNALAVRKIFKKYDKVHGSTEGGLFKSRLMALRGELLKSPYLLELGALHLNLGDDSCSPTFTCKVRESTSLDFDLSCSICLEPLFEPVALGCGHLFCNTRACTASSVVGHEGPKTARCDAKCPLCRQVGVYPDAVKLKELSVLIKNRCPEYWKERSQ